MDIVTHSQTPDRAASDGLPGEEQGGTCGSVPVKNAGSAESKGGSGQSGVRKISRNPSDAEVSGDEEDAGEEETEALKDSFFGGACHLVWREGGDLLDYEYGHEVQTALELLREDCIIHKSDSLVLSDPVGSFFRRHNLCQFKPAATTFASSDFLKELAFLTCYLEQNRGTAAEDCTTTVFCASRCDETLQWADRCIRFSVHWKESGSICCLENPELMRIQIVFLGSLEGETDGQYAPLNVYAEDVTLEHFRKLRQYEDSLGQDAEERRLVKYIFDAFGKSSLKS